MSRPIWFVNLLKKGFPGRFQFARLTHAPLVGPIVDRLLFDGDEIIYLPRDGIIHVGETIPDVQEFAVPSEVLIHFINEASHHWLMDFCICRSSADCQDYPASFGCLFLGEAVLKINPKLGRLVSRAEALNHVRRCREAGLVHMIGRNKLDTIWLGVGPGHRLLTICNCCPCCCLWKMLPDLSPTIGRKINRMPGVRVLVTDLCTGCELCAEDFCFVDAIDMDGPYANIDSDRCRGCGRCVEACPYQAIEISIESTTFVNATIELISPLVELKSQINS
jgi:ferredoxin